MTDHHVTTVHLTGSGWRARCLTRGCNWTGQNHLFLLPNTQACAWSQAVDDGRRHATDERLKIARR